MVLSCHRGTYRCTCWCLYFLFSSWHITGWCSQCYACLLLLFLLAHDIVMLSLSRLAAFSSSVGTWQSDVVSVTLDWLFFFSPRKMNQILISTRYVWLDLNNRFFAVRDECTATIPFSGLHRKGNRKHLKLSNRTVVFLNLLTELAEEDTLSEVDTNEQFFKITNMRKEDTV